MKLFSKKEKIVFRSEKQKDAFIDKLQRSHIDYNIRERKDSIFDNDSTFIIRINTVDLKKVV